MPNSKKNFISTEKFYISILIFLLFCAFFYFFYRKNIIENVQSKKLSKGIINKINKINNKNKKTYPGIKVIAVGNYNSLYKKLVDYQTKNPNEKNLVKYTRTSKNKLIIFDKNVTVSRALKYLNANSADLGIAQYLPST
jgi:hypothetical protein